MVTWYEQDSFWETMPMFTEERWQVAPAEVDAVLSLLRSVEPVALGVEPGAAVLDLPCGAGRHSLEFARRGYRVTGVDRTAAYLRMAREKADVEGLDLQLVQADMREFVRPATFDLALNLFTSFGYFEDPADDWQVAHNIFRSLRPGGVLVMEMMGKEVLARIFSPCDWQELPDGTLFLQARKVTDDWTWMENRWILVSGNRRREYEVGHRIYDGSGIRSLLLDTGFDAVRLFGGLGGEPYDVQARRLVAVAHRGAG